MARLKVFTWSDGFHAFTVATTSRPKALAAWGMNQDIFKSGLAQEITEGPAFDAALATPDQVIQTGEAINPGRSSTSTRHPKRPRPKAAQKARISRLEAQLETVDLSYETRFAQLDAELVALQTKGARADAEHQKERGVLVAELKAARKTS